MSDKKQTPKLPAGVTRWGLNVRPNESTRGQTAKNQSKSKPATPPPPPRKKDK